MSGHKIVDVKEAAKRVLEIFNSLKYGEGVILAEDCVEKGRLSGFSDEDIKRVMNKKKNAS